MINNKCCKITLAAVMIIFSSANLPQLMAQDLALGVENALQLLLEDTNIEGRIGGITSLAEEQETLVSDDGYLVQPGDSLGAIITTLYGGNSIIRRSAIAQALVNKNPSAFVSGNQNRLLAGATLQILTPDDLLNLIFNDYGGEVSNLSTATAGWVKFSR